MCCGEAEQKFLTLDHINNDGYMFRKRSKESKAEFSAGTHYWAWLVRNKFPKEHKLQVLCMNCNWGKRQNGGVCPHKT